MRIKKKHVFWGLQHWRKYVLTWFKKFFWSDFKIRQRIGWVIVHELFLLQISLERDRRWVWLIEFLLSISFNFVPLTLIFFDKISFSEGFWCFGESTHDNINLTCSLAKTIKFKIFGAKWYRFIFQKPRSNVNCF